MAEPTVAGVHVVERAEEEPPVRLVTKDRLPGVAPGGDVIDGAGIFDAEGPSHANSLAG